MKQETSRIRKYFWVATTALAIGVGVGAAYSNRINDARDTLCDKLIEIDTAGKQYTPQFLKDGWEWHRKQWFDK